MADDTPKRFWQISDELWARLEPLIPPPAKKHPWGVHNPRVPNRSAMNAILFVLRTGCQWNALNATGICSSSSAHRRFQEWTEAGLFQEMWRQGLFEYDELQGLDLEWLALDGAMTKAPLGGAATGPNPTDRSKIGTKRSVITDGAGIPLGGVIAGANVNDHLLAEKTLQSMPLNPAAIAQAEDEQPPGLLLDAGYFYTVIYELLAEWGYTAHIRPVGSGKLAAMTVEEREAAGARARRWVVERTHSWLNRFRGLLVRWCKKPQNHLALLHFAFCLITYQALGLPG